jgi:hypothetical protein
MQQVYDNIATTLKNQGFEVVRNPLPLVYTKRNVSREAFNKPNNALLYNIYQKLLEAGQGTVELREWYFATSNNALVHNSSAGKRLYGKGGCP